MLPEFTSTPTGAPATRVSTGPDTSTAVAFGKRNPFSAKVLDVVLLNGRGSAKETVHMELDLAGSGLCYEPGDALAVMSVNGPHRIRMLLEAAKLTGKEPIDNKISGPKLLADALREDFDITDLSRKVLGKLADATGSARLRDLLAEDAPERLREYVAGREIVDAIHDFAPSGLSAEALTGIFRKLAPRLYSIASSPLAHPGQVHLTVAAVRYESHGLLRHGVCSTFLADLVKPGDSVGVFVQPNPNFRLPADGSCPLIMVGPGTGVAPFRAFIQHRAALGHSGKNWLFLGDQHSLYDFIYQTEWQAHLNNGTLSRLDVAFSRDQPAKIYVQHRMREAARQLYAWLEQGACFHVCGDAIRMAVDVHETLVGIVAEQGAKSREAAEEYVEQLKRSKRYQRDVY